jgi:hypothetical protein
MKRSLGLTLIVLIVVSNLLIGPTPAEPARAADLPITTEEEASFLRIAGLKAVLIVGPIDGDTGQWTRQEIAHMELAAAFLEARDVAVHRFYTPNNDWEAIKAAARGAHFLLYRGHGPAWNSIPDVGGFMLKSGLVRPALLIQELALAPNAIVMLYACYSAGSSGEDTFDIGVVEARRRVLQYSDPFLELGSAGYFANWYGDAFEHFLRALFAGHSLSGAYQSYSGYNAETVQVLRHPTVPEATVSLDKNNWRGYWQYHNAFVGRPDATLNELFNPADLGGIPDHLRFVYSLSEGRYLVDSYTVVPRNLASTLQLPWSLEKTAGWVTVSRTAGMTGDQGFTVRPNLSAAALQGSYTGSLTVYCELTGQSEIIYLTLEVIEGSFSRTFLPVALSAYATRR